MAWIPLLFSAGASIYNGIRQGRQGSAQDKELAGQRLRINNSVGDIQNLINQRNWNPTTQQYEASQHSQQGDEIYGGYKDLLGGNYGTSLGPGGSGRTGNVEGLISDYKNFANKPISDADQARARGGGVFDEFSKTGGWSDSNKADYRRRAGAVVPQMFGQVNNELQRKQAISGGGGNISGATARNLRQQALAAQDASTNAELGLQDQVNAGRKWGTEGMSGSELSLQDLSTRSKLAGLGGASGLEMGLMSAEDQRALNAAGIDLQGQDMGIRAKLGALGGMSNMWSQPTEDDKKIQQLMQLLGIQNSGLSSTYGVPSAGNFFQGFNQAGQATAPFASGLSQYLQQRNS